MPDRVGGGGLRPPSRRELVLSANRFIHNQQLILLLLAVVAGSAAALGAIVFREVVILGQMATFGGSLEGLSDLVRNLPEWQIVAVPTLGGLGIGLFVRYVMPERRNRGVADVIEAVALKSGSISVREGLGAAAASAASISVGASVGREGPVVHLGAALSSFIATRLHLDRSQAVTLLGCGVASAVAASFNAPIAGVFFALEVVIGHYALQAFAPIVIASVLGTVISRLHFGDFPAFIIPEQSLVSLWEFPAFALLGGVCAVMVIILLRSISLAASVADRAPGPQWLKPMAGGLCVGLIALAYPEILGVGYEATDAALKGNYELAILIALAVAKTAATAICLGCGFGGGIFSPSLFIGAMVGGAFGIIATQTFPELSSGISVYTLVGLGAVAGAVLGAPISTILIVFELTANYALTIVVMVAVVIASVIAQQLKSQSFFRWQLARRNVDLEAGHDEISSTNVSEATRRDHAVIGVSDGLNNLRESLLSAPCNELFVVDSDGKLEGSIRVEILADLPESGVSRAADVMEPVVATVKLDDSLDHALTVMERQGVEHAAVIEKENRLAGYLRKIDLVLAYNEALLEARRRERSGL